jgi:hypothetical protein
MIGAEGVEVDPSNLKTDEADEGRAIQDGVEAADTYVQYRKGSYDLTLKIGRALDIVAKRAMRDTRSMKEAGKAYQAAIAEALRLLGFDRIDKGERSRMREVYRSRQTINAWRDALPENKRDDLTGAGAVLRAFKKYEREQRGEEPKQRSSLAEENAQLKAKVKDLQQRLDEMSEDGGSVITKDSTAQDIVDWLVRTFSFAKFNDIYGRMKKAQPDAKAQDEKEPRKKREPGPRPEKWKLGTRPDLFPDSKVEDKAFRSFTASTKRSPENVEELHAYARQKGLVEEGSDKPSEDVL